MIKPILPLSLLVMFVSTCAASAQTDSYTAADATHMQQCLEAVRDIGNDAESQTQADYRDCIGVASTACQDESPDSTTTIGMVECAARETAWWDEQLNTHYTHLRETLDEEEFAHLRDAQRAWIAYKDAKCAFEYFYWRDGTIRSIFGSTCILDETAQRAIDLIGVVEWSDL